MTNRRQSGYSLAEMLTVIAIVGALALVTVPAFMTYMQSNKMKSSMRQITTDLRSARQRSISQGQQIVLTYAAGPTSRSYDIYQGDRPFNSTTWTKTGLPEALKTTRRMNDVIYFPADTASPPTLQTFSDSLNCGTTTCSSGTDSKFDVIFFPDGRVQMPSGATTGTITLKTDMRIPKSVYTISITPSGRVQAN